MFEVTIKGATMSDLATALILMAGQFQTTPASGDAKPARAKKTAPAPEPEAPVEEVETDNVDAELLAPVEPMPDTAKAVVDAGTGRPAEKPAAGGTKKMTIDDVKKEAAKLAAADVEGLKLILSKYGAGKISEVAPAKLGDFAADVIEKLGELEALS